MRESFGRKKDEQVREAVAEIISTDISDPRVSLITITGAKVSSDRSVANIYVSASPDRYEDVLSGLESAKGRVRSRLGHILGWRVTPELRFFIDESVDAGERIAEALTHIPPTLANQAEGDEESRDEGDEG